MHLKKFEGVDLKYNNGFFEFNPKKTQAKHFLSKCKFSLYLHETSHIEKFEGTDFENGSSFFQLPAKNTQTWNFKWNFEWI